MVWGILLGYAVACPVLNLAIFDHIEHDWEHLAFASFDWLVAWSILKCCKGGLAVYQSCCLLASYILNLVLYYDLKESTDLVYGQYEIYVILIHAAVLAPSTNGIIKAAREFFRDTLGSFFYRAASINGRMAGIQKVVQNQGNKKSW